jgi:hypothetical protein
MQNGSPRQLREPLVDGPPAAVGSRRPGGRTGSRPPGRGPDGARGVVSIRVADDRITDLWMVLNTAGLSEKT